jgi:hypothetical protein
MSKDWNDIDITRERGIMLARQPGADDKALQAGIDATMRDVITRDARHDPLRPKEWQTQKVGVVGAVPGPGFAVNTTGWREAQKLEHPLAGTYAEKVVSDMIDAALGPPVRKHVPAQPVTPEAPAQPQSETAGERQPAAVTRRRTL